MLKTYCDADPFVSWVLETLTGQDMQKSAIEAANVEAANVWKVAA